MPLEKQGELQNNLASSAQIDPGVIMKHIGLIHEQLEYVQLLLNDENRLKNINTRQPYSKADEGDSNARTSPHYFQEVKYKMVVRGQTFGAHTQLMDQVKRATKGDVRLLENSQDSQIIIVFCPITSRIEWDVKAAMSGVPGDKPVILVKMHHVPVMGDLLRNTRLMSQRQPDVLKPAHIDPGVFMDHNRFIDEQLINVQLLLNDTKDLLKKINTGQPDSKADEGAVMGDLLRKYR
ncbi:unnamed protein product [Pleuronectes platessa]|uniref:Uncharacterized protein n=1 Tax=Pleuronectes platessa TaxID=8262 RepID=A0A9N7V3A0_PLEPL|nr:unnamed protein product [Pleuronectes platessa]